MKLIIAGGRGYSLTEADFRKLDSLEIALSEVVSGCARGADTGGEYYARARSIPVRQFPADWATWGRAAGHIRNKQMAGYADAVALFPGGRGTANMAKEAKAAGIKVYDFRRAPPPAEGGRGVG